jgi:type IV secretory pathway VirB6-like protein
MSKHRSPFWKILLLMGMLLAAPDARAAMLCDFTTGGVTGPIVQCLRVALVGVDGTGGVVKQLHTAIYNEVKDIVSGLIVLAIAIFGLKLALRLVKDVRAETSMFVIQVAAVWYFSEHLVDWFPDIMLALEDLLRIVTSSLLDVSSPTLTCELATSAANTHMQMWNRVDCMMGVIFGFGASTGLISGLVAIIIAGATSDPTIGWAIFSGGLGVMLTLMLSVCRAVYMYICCYIALIFLVAISPLVIPLILFKPTKQYFNQWRFHAIGFALQPVIIFGFLAFMIMVFNNAVLFGNHSLAQVLFGEPVKSYTEMGERMERFNIANIQDCENRMAATMNIPDTAQEMAGSTLEFQPNDPTRGMAIVDEFLRGLDPALTEGKNLSVVGAFLEPIKGFMSYGIKLPCLDYVKGPQIFYAFFAISIVGYLLYALLQYVPIMTAEVLAMGSNLSSISMPLETQLRGAVNTVGSGNFSTQNLWNNVFPRR